MKLPHDKFCVPRIFYETGAGGQWLNYTLWALENNYTELPLIKRVNFHDVNLEPNQRTKFFQMAHNQTGAVQPGYVFGGPYRFNYFLNGWHKLWIQENVNGINNTPLASQILMLGHDAASKLDNINASVYETNVDLDYALIFKDTVRFRNQLIAMLSKSLEHWWPQEYIPRITQQFVDSAAAAFKITAIDPMLHLGNVNSAGWLAWSHAMCLKNNVDLPVIRNDAIEFRSWLKSNQDWIIEKTREYIV